MNTKTYEELSRRIPEIESKLGYSFKDRSLLAMAFIHRSYINESKDAENHNERLEFLGDSILNMLIADYLYRYLPSTPEGELSVLRARLVEASSCHNYIQKYGLGEYILLGKGERMNDGRGRDSILADLLEAIIGAIYIDGGLDAARRFLFKNFSTEIDAILRMPLRNYKAILQDYCQKKYQKAPSYHVLSEEGPDHSKVFKIVVTIFDKEIGHGQGASKKEAQQAAAESALTRYQVLEEA